MLYLMINMPWFCFDHTIVGKNHHDHTSSWRDCYVWLLHRVFWKNWTSVLYKKEEKRIFPIFKQGDIWFQKKFTIHLLIIRWLAFFKCFFFSFLKMHVTKVMLRTSLVSSALAFYSNRPTITVYCVTTNAQTLKKRSLHKKNFTKSRY